MISASLYTYLAAQSAITTICSTRIHPVILPQKPTYPAITYNESVHDLIETFDGQSGLTNSLYDIDAWATTFAGAVTLSNAIRAALKNHTGNMGLISVCKITLIAGPIPIYEDEVEAYRLTQTFSIWHNEE